MKRTKDEFVAAVVSDYEAGQENAYEYLKVAGYTQAEDEDDLAFVRRALEQDYHDADHCGCVYADYLEA